MHANDLLGSLGALSNVGDGDGRCVGSEDAMVRSDLFTLSDDLSLEVDVFEHSLDDHVGMSKVSFPVFHVVGEPGDVRGVDVVFVVGHTFFADFLFPVGVDVGLSA